MKTEIVSGEVGPKKEIDWSISQLVVAKKLKTLILTNGEHMEGHFEGTVIFQDGIWELGTFKTDWIKDRFTFITEPLTIKFIP